MKELCRRRSWASQKWEKVQENGEKLSGWWMEWGLCSHILHRDHFHWTMQCCTLAIPGFGRKARIVSRGNADVRRKRDSPNPLWCTSPSGVCDSSKSLWISDLPQEAGFVFWFPALTSLGCCEPSRQERVGLFAVIFLWGPSSGFC